MKKIILLVTFFVANITLAQVGNTQSNPTQNQQNNAAQSILQNTTSKGVTLGGYAQIDYNQPEGDNGKLDVHRLVVLMGYKFNDKVQFVTEIEYEHVKEVYIEQAFLN